MQIYPHGFSSRFQPVHSHTRWHTRMVHPGMGCQRLLNLACLCSCVLSVVTFSPTSQQQVQEHSRRQLTGSGDDSIQERSTLAYDDDDAAAVLESLVAGYSDHRTIRCALFPDQGHLT